MEDFNIRAITGDKLTHISRKVSIAQTYLTTLERFIRHPRSHSMSILFHPFMTDKSLYCNQLRTLMTKPCEKCGLRVAGILLAFVFFFQHNCYAENDMSFSIYNAVLTETPIEETLINLSEIDDSFKLTALAVNKKIRSLNEHIDLELEGQVVKHWGNQHHFEFNGLFLLRWQTFPWNRYLKTSFAVGDGLSYATRTPEFELIVNDRSTKLLNFMIWELSFAHPKAKHWSYLFRIHHRSGIFGIFSDINGGSNALALGARYTF